VRDPNCDAQALCQAVYEQGDFDLATKEGCGLYTEACCLALFTQQSAWWGHIRKEPAQNQYNGHAVDALQLMIQAGGTQAGIYDIIWSTESPEAEPAWSYKGPPDLNLWYPPV
jgi:glutaminase